jgi:protein-tyrosine phosphatase
MLDFHNHLMPGVDDGAANIAESRTGLATMQEQGVTTIVTTPHLRASLVERKRDLDAYLVDLDLAFEELKFLAAAEFPNLRIERGVELMLDIPRPRLTDERLRLGGSPFVLMEFPHMSIPPHSSVAIRELRSTGVIPIIAHPERYSNMTNNVGLIEGWRDAGAFIQVNAGSAVGQYGTSARKLFALILENGWADYMCSDYHSRGRCSVSAAASWMLERDGRSQLHALTVENPERILRSEAPLPVEPLEDIQTGFWKKIFKA